MGLGNNLHHLELVILVVGVHNLMIYLGMVIVVVVACVLVGQSGLHQNNFFCGNYLAMVGGCGIGVDISG